ncbi:putative bifunctional diguanylate cyclase/phosphodiesterase [Hydrogenovibrio kuenenii]|uniref:putative bifunctional diguanylate cyclase/phosphodiesterase n=1 Tax=Hydrogenovibrio kuenenii TaxID=63658 RepID=UPI0004636615|nr:EAL domain-containing protein [Hydrogenovibrio kuenenii]
MVSQQKRTNFTASNVLERKPFKSLRFYHALFESCLTPAILLCPNGKIVFINTPACDFLSLSESIVGRHFHDLLSSDSTEIFIRFLNTRDESIGHQVVHQNHVFELHDGSFFTLHSQLLKLDPSEESYCLVYLNPLTEESSNIHSLHLANALIDQIGDGVLLMDEQGKIIKANRAFSVTTGYAQMEVINQRPTLFRSGVHNDDYYQNLWKSLDDEGSWRGEIWSRRKNGTIYPGWLQASKIVDEFSGKPFYVGVMADMSTKKADEKRLDRLAYYDSLTGLANRTLLTRYLETSIIESQKNNGGKVAVLFVDLDKFKYVNDHFGHSEGDWILQEASKRISSYIREPDLACRFGGDEFVIVLTQIVRDRSVEEMAESLVRRLSKPYVRGKHIHRLTASIGVTFYPEHGDNVEELLRRADSAMCRAKEQGRNSCQLFEERDEQDLIEMNLMARLIWQAIEKPKSYIEMHYQPIFRKDSFVTPVEYEALIRLKNDDGKLIYPINFIEYAEQNGLISQLGFALFEKVCDDINAKRLDDNIKIGINLSAVQLDNPKLVEKLCAISHNKSVPINRFNFEVTETAIMHNVSATIDALQKLRKEGCHILLDDFGTGYASLAILKKLPIDIVKIDREFVNDIETSNETQEMVKAMIAMSKAMNLKVLIEGVETEAQKRWLENKEVDLFQGYLLGRPAQLA